jgi:hypothetical protein
VWYWLCNWVGNGLCAPTGYLASPMPILCCHCLPLTCLSFNLQPSDRALQAAQAPVTSTEPPTATAAPEAWQAAETATAPTGECLLGLCTTCSHILSL